MLEVKNYINGDHVAISNEELSVYDPSTGDEIKKVVNDGERQSTKEKNLPTEIHEDEDDTARIGRSGDPLKIKKI